MSKICIISGNHRDQAYACYDHFQKRKQTQLVSLFSSAKDFMQSQATDLAHLLVVDETELPSIIHFINAHESSRQRDILVLGETSKNPAYAHCHLLLGNFSPSSLLAAIGILSLGSDWIQMAIPQNKRSKIIAKVHEDIRYVQYSSKTIEFGLRQAALIYGGHGRLKMPLDAPCFLTINPTAIVNIDHIRKFNADAVIMDENEEIIVDPDCLDECWQAFCRYLMPRQNGLLWRLNRKNRVEANNQ